MRNTLNLFIIKYQYRTIHKGRPAKGGGVRQNRVSADGGGGWSAGPDVRIFLYRNLDFSTLKVTNTHLLSKIIAILGLGRTTVFILRQFGRVKIFFDSKFFPNLPKIYVQELPYEIM